MALADPRPTTAPTTAPKMTHRAPKPTPQAARGTDSWSGVQAKLRARGLRWTPQRRLILEVLASQDGHVTGSDVVERCRERDALTTPSTVYRTLEVLEEVGYLHHSHGPDGRQEYHVLPAREHAHLRCDACGRTWEVEPDEARGLLDGLRRARGFRVDLGHLTIAGRCRDCAEAG